VKNRVLVTGGAGFLGSHLCPRLLNQECKVLCVDNYFTVNLGSPFEVSILELAELVLFLAGSRSRLEFRSPPQDDPRQRCPAITRAWQLLHWSPKVGLREGLGRTIEYFDRLLSSPSEARKLVWKLAV